MSLTSNQKHYIKKNVEKLGIKQTAADLKLSEREISKYLKKRISPEKYRKIAQKQNGYESQQSDIGSFSLKKFVADNLGTFVFLAILVLVCYFNAWGNSFVSDDIGNIKNNAQLGDLSYVFSQIVGTIQRILYFAIYKVFGLNPVYFRTLNIIIHLLNTFAVFTLLSLLAKRPVAFFASSLFAVHPILVESITWISGFPYALYTFFVLLAFLSYVRERKIWTLVFFLLGLLSSEKAIIFPAIIFVFEMSRGNLKESWKKLIPAFSVDLIFILFYISQINRRVSDISSVSYQDSSGMYNPLIQVPTAIANYFKLIFWPQKLSLYQTEMNFSVPQYVIFSILFITLLSAIFYGWKKNKSLFFWLSFFLISLAPVLTPLKIAWVVAERYVYLGSIGIFVAAAIFFDWAAGKLEEEDEKNKMAVYFIFVAIIIALSTRTIFRNIDWKDEDHLWVATSKVASSGPNIHNNMGDVYARNGDLEKASEEFRKALEINPNYADAYHNLGNTYNSLGKADLAAENYLKALSINPNIWQSHQNLAGIYFNQGNYQKAYESIKKATEINPTDENLKKNMAIIEERVNAAK